MKHVAIDRAAARRIDQRAWHEYGLSGLVLMENAGRGVADCLERLGIDGPVVICCGKGNNGGDGFVIARHLDLRGYDVRVLVWATAEELGKAASDAAVNYRAIAAAQIAIEHFTPQHDPAALVHALAGADWIVDALLGTGAVGPPRPPFGAVIRQLNEAKAKKMAVDLPSGLDCDTGVPADPTYRADHTCTFVAAKTGFLTPRAVDFVGRVHVLDIGAPRRLVDDCLDAG